MKMYICTVLCIYTLSCNISKGFKYCLLFSLTFYDWLVKLSGFRQIYVQGCGLSSQSSSPIPQYVTFE